MRDDQKTKADLLQELSTLRERVTGLKQAAEQWSKTFDATSDLVFVQDKDFRFVKVNKSVCDLLKVKPEDLIGKKCYEVLHKSDKPWPNCPLAKALKDKKPHTEEVDDPNIGIPLLITSSPSFDENGELTSVVHIATDITERKRMEEALLISAQQYCDIFDCATDAIFILDSENHIVDTNPEACKMFGYSSGEMIGLAAHKLVHPDYRRKPEEFRNAIEPTGQTHFEAVNLRKDGTPFNVEVRGTIFTHNGNEHFLVTVRDITERKKAEKKIEELAKFPAENPNPVLRVTKDGTIIYANEASDALLRECRDSYCQVGESLPDQWCQVAADVSSSGLVKEIEVEYECCTMSLTFAPVVDFGYVNIYGLDITERKRAEETLRENEERLRVALSAAQMGTWRWNPVTNQDTRDASLNLILGLEAVESTQPVEDFLHFVHPEDRDMVDEEIQRAIRERRTYVAEFRIIRPDGTVRWLRDQGKPLCDENDRVLCLTGAVIDITERKEAEEEIEKFKKMADLATHGCAMVDLDGNLVYINDGFARMHGYAPAELIGKNLEIFHTDAQIKRVSEINKRLMETGQGIQAEEVWHVRRDGTEFPTLMSNWVLKDDNGNPLLMCATAIDITERKKAEEDLLFKSTLLEAQSETSIDGILVVGTEGKSISLNKRFGRMWNIPQQILDTRDDEKMLQYVLTQLKNPDQFLEKVKYLYAHKNEKSRDEIQFKDGRVFDRYSSPLLDSNDKYYGRVWYFRDITERKKAEEALRDSEERFALAVRGSNAGLWDWDVLDKSLYWSPRMKELLGYAGDELDVDFGTFESHLHPDDREHTAAAIEAHLKDGGLYEVEQRLRTKSGEYRWFGVRGQALWNEAGNPIRMIGFTTDITERKKVEEQLAKTKERLGYILTATPVTIYTCEAGGNWAATFISENVRDQCGYEPHQFLEDYNFWVEHIHPDDRQHVLTGLSRLLDDDFYVHEYRFLHKDGSYRWMHDESRLIRDEQGKPLECIGYWTDITERKQAEERLKQAADEWMTTFNSITDLVSIHDKDFKIVRVNSAFADVFKAKPEEITGRFCYELIHGTKEPPSFCPHKKTLDTKKPQRAEYFEPHLGVEIEASTSPIFDENGRIIASVHITKDITERKKAEEELKESESKYKTLVENLPQKIFLKDKNSVFVSCNDNLARDFKIKSEEIAGKTDYDFLPKELAEKYRADDKRIIESGQTAAIEEKYIQEGKERIVRTVKTPVRDEQGNVIGVLGIFWDITELKRREKEINLYREKMARAEQLVSLGTVGATVAHELTQPLTVIRLSIENSLADLDTKSCPSAVTEGLKDSLAEISHAVSIINRLRSFARKSSKRDVAQVNLKAVADRVTQLLDAQAWRAKVTVSLKNMDKLPPVLMNERDLEQLFFSLVENAVQAAGGRKDRQLIISGDVKDEYIELQFSDNCGGIARKNLDKIFEPFFTTRPAGEGTGLGLCIVQRIVSQADGKVRVESKAGKGSTFFITLPINKGRKVRLNGDSR